MVLHIRTTPAIPSGHRYAYHTRDRSLAPRRSTEQIRRREEDRHCGHYEHGRENPEEQPIYYHGGELPVSHLVRGGGVVFDLPGDEAQFVEDAEQLVAYVVRVGGF